MRFMRELIAAGLLAAWCAGCGNPGSDVRQRQWAACTAKQIQSERRVAACSARLQSGQENVADRSTAFNNRGVAYQQMGQLVAALKDFDAALSLKPDNPDALPNRARAYLSLGQPAKAVEDLNHAIALAPKNAVLFDLRAGAFAALDKSDRALADFHQALTLNPNSVEALYNRCFLYISLQQADNALKDCDRAVAIAPKDAVAVNNRGVALRYLGQYARAVTDFDKALALKPGWTLAISNRGLSYRDMGDQKHAFEDFRKVIASIEATDADGLNARCWERATWGFELDAALQDCNRSLELAPREAHTLDSRGLVRYRLRDYPGAVKDYDAALAIESGSASSLFMRGLAKRKLGEAGADADVAAAKALNPAIARNYASFGVKPD